jgi:hypothetical protein
MPEKFNIIGSISNIETFAVKNSIRDLPRLNKMYGRLAELHWYEAHGIGKREIRRKRFLD